MERFDYIVVGGGAAGSVLANRLSESGKQTVLLIEAGADVPPGRVPNDIRSVFPLSTFNPDYTWRELRGHWRKQTDSPLVPIQQGKILGGGSAIMGMWAMRGHPADYDKWQEAGADGWSWEDVLPYFRKLESDQDFIGPMHGRDGPIPIRRQLRADWSPFARAVETAALREGYVCVDDMNADFRDGHCILPVSRFESERASAGLCYLGGGIRARSNLRIETHQTVDRILIDGRHVTGVCVRRPDGSERVFAATEVLVAAGALQSPVLLMRAGVGPADELRSCGIEVVADRPGVGTNLQNHLILCAAAFINRESRDPSGWRPPASTFIRWSSGIEGCPPGDMSIYVRSYLSWHALGRRMAMLAPVLMRPEATGSVRLRPRQSNPLIEFNLLGTASDLARMMSGFRTAVRLFETPEVAALCRNPFVLVNAARLMRYNEVTPPNRLQGWLATALLDLAPSLARTMFDRLAQFRPVRSFVDDDDELAAFVKSNINGTFHVCGTCRMGRSNQRFAVTDPSGRVYGVEGLRVVDASIMPSVPAGNTHLPVVMVAEKLADSIRASSGAIRAWPAHEPMSTASIGSGS